MLNRRMVSALWVSLLVVPTVMAQQSGAGVLIGVLADSGTPEGAQAFEEIKLPQYQTLWIAPDAAGRLALLSTIPNLIVPMRDGFWHIGVKQICVFDQDLTGETGGNEHIQQLVWRAPVWMAAPLAAPQLCREHDPSAYAPPYGRSEEDAKKISQCGYQLAEIEYVSPALLSVKKYTGQSEDCEPRGGRYNLDYSVVGYETAQDDSLTVSQVLGDDARTAYLKALPKQGQGDGGEDCGEATDRDDGWRIGRHAGRWAIFAHQDLGYFGCSVDAYVPLRLPSNITGDIPPAPEWKQLKATVKDFRDAYVSPGKDWLIVTTGTELRFHEYRAGSPGKLLLTLPAKPIVMMQWCTGKHVQDWTQQMEAMSKKPLPEPKLQVAIK